MNLLQRTINYFGFNKKATSTIKVKEKAELVSPVEKPTNTPAGRSSLPEYESEYGDKFAGIEEYSKPDFILDIIPKLRSLTKINEDVGAVYNDFIQLTNTGHKIIFNQSISEQERDKMYHHLKAKRKTWGSGVHGIDGLINKWIGQIWIAGALSNEWVVARDLSGVTNSVLVNPENIRFKYNFTTTKYDPYQLIKNKLLKGNALDNAIKLNTNSYFYAGILGDTDSPYGIPPFMTAFGALETQSDMKRNINHILKQLGLLGYLEVRLAKPTQRANESVKAYEQRLDKLLLDSKKNVTDGFMEGVVTGFEEDHEFEFHATGKNLSGVSEIFNQNEVQVSNGLKSAPTFIGQKSNGTESNLGIVFTKLLSQLKNVQQLVAQNLEMGYLLELRLAGFTIKSEDISVEFKTSTISDELKLWQAKEIKQRTLKGLVIDGIIGQDLYAEEMGYDKPFSKKPIVPYKDQAGVATKTGEGVQKDKDTKNKSARKSRDTDKKQPKRKDTNTKPQ